MAEVVYSANQITLAIGHDGTEFAVKIDCPDHEVWFGSTIDKFPKFIESVVVGLANEKLPRPVQQLPLGRMQNFVAAKPIVFATSESLELMVLTAFLPANTQISFAITPEAGMQLAERIGHTASEMIHNRQKAAH
jgi:hypothetical protein